ncbi:MAG: transcriptional repressor [Verrucomicrobiota bacterium]
MTIDECRDKFRTFLAKHNLRMTGQRMAIFEAVFKETSHFTAEELLEKARQIDRTVSRATVSRLRVGGGFRPIWEVYYRQ